MSAFTDLGTLGGINSHAYACSTDGSIVVGYAQNSSGVYRAFKYQNSTMTDLGTLGGLDSYAYGCSLDGSIIVGTSKNGGQQSRAFKYQGGSMTDLGTLGGTSLAYACSSDGSIVVGVAYNLSNNARAFRYVASTMYDLGTLGGSTSRAYGCSADGSIIVGSADTTEDGDEHAFRYQNGVMTDLGTLGGTTSVAQAISATGNYIVGESQTASGDDHAFLYSGGTMIDIGTLGGSYSIALGISDDETYVVGESQTLLGEYHAFKYDIANQTMIDLGTLGGTGSVARACSFDASIIVGSSQNASEELRAFVYAPIPTTIPTAPLIYEQPFASDQTLEFNWDPPVSDGNSAILDYRLQMNPGALTQTYPATARYATVTGLNNTVLYSTTLEARNTNGYSPAIAFRPFQPGTGPIYSVSTATVTWVSTTTAVVSWTPPIAQPTSRLYWYVLEGTTNGNLIDSQRYSAAAPTRSNYYITNLNQSTSYVFNVYAANCADWSPPTSTNILSYFDPTQIPNCSLWVDASDPTTISTTTVSGNSNIVRFIYDKSPYKNTINQTQTNNITILPYAQGNRNVLNFFGTGLQGIFSSIYTGPDASAFAVFASSNQVNFDSKILSIGKPGVWDLQDPPSAPIIGRNGAAMGTQRNATRQANPILNDQWGFTYGNQRPNVGTAVLYGSSITSSITNTSVNLFISTFTIGSGAGNGDAYWGSVGEVICYFSTLTTQERQKVEGYLAWKWGLQTSLPSTHPWYQYGPYWPNPRPPFSPLQIPNLTLWLDAADSTTIRYSTTQVSTWLDKSGSNMHASTFGGTISYSTIVQNGLNVVSFDGGGNRMRSFINYNNPSITAFWSGYISPTTPDTSVSRILTLAPIGSQDYGNGSYAGVMFQYTGQRIGCLRAAAVMTSGPSFPKGQWNIADGIQVPGYQYAGVNGSNLQMQVTNTGGNMQSQQFIIGGQGLDGEYLSGQMGEILVYRSTLTSTQQFQVQGYLAWKWGTQSKLPPDHPFKTFAP